MLACTVHKFDFNPTIQYEGGTAGFVDLPVNAKIVHVGEQNGVIHIWAQVEQLPRREVRRKFLRVPTGGIVTPNAEHIGTVQMESGLVWHVYEEH